MKKLHVLIALVLLASVGFISTSIAGQNGGNAEKSAKKKKGKAKAKPGPAGPQGPAGTPAPAALTPIAIGRLSQTTGADSVDNARSVGLTDANVNHTSLGVWCFGGMSPAPRVIIATAGLAGANNPTGLITADAQANAACPMTHQQGTIIVFEGASPFGQQQNVFLNVVVY